MSEYQCNGETSTESTLSWHVF